MTKLFLTKTLAVLLVVALVAPSAYFVMPQRATAAGIGGAVGCFLSLGSMGISAVSSLLSVPVADSITRSATSGECVNDTIFLPLARAMARLMLARITASIIGWITGKNGQVMFVTNLPGHLQNTGDVAALAFFNQFARNSNSPFAAAIASSLRANYLRTTSLAGFFAANQNTLYRYSQNQTAFLAGNWSQGGVGAWFALTTQSQNNPYLLYQASQTQLAGLVGAAMANQLRTLDWGRGFLSWCGPGKEGDSSGGLKEDAAGNVTSSVGTAPGDSCKNNDGTYGAVQTPGSIIHDISQKALTATGIDWLISAQDLDSALGAISMAVVGEVLGGVTGLLGSSASSPNNRTLTSQLQNYSANNASGAASSISLVQTKLSQIVLYTNAWSTMGASANAASTTLASMISYCTSQGAVTQADAGRTALSTYVAPIIAAAKAIPASVAETQAFALQVEATAAASATISTTTTTLSAELDRLFSMPPSGDAVTAAQYDAQSLGRAAAFPPNSLNVSGGTVVDRMNLLSTNATIVRDTCTPPVFNPNDSTSGGI